jgi:hypothetical protein
VCFLSKSKFCAEPVDWSMAHHLTNYLDMVKVKYRTFHIEYPNYEVLLVSWFFFSFFVISTFVHGVYLECDFFFANRLLVSYHPCFLMSLVLRCISTIS